MNVAFILLQCLFVTFSWENDQFAENLSETEMIDKLIAFVLYKKWKNLLILTDYNDDKLLSNYFSNCCVYFSIIKLSKDSLEYPPTINFTQYHGQQNTIVWCPISYLEDIIKQMNIFDKSHHSLFAFRTKSEFFNHFRLFKHYIRIDSEVYGILPEADKSWAILRLHYLTELKIKTVATYSQQKKFINTEESQPLLQNIVLLASVFHFPPQSYVDKIDRGIQVRGVRHNILTALSQYLGFKINYKAITTSEQPIQPESYNIQRKLLRNKEVNLTGVFMPINTPDLVYFTPSSHAFTVSLALVFRNIKYHPQSQKISTAYSKPFSTQVWIWILLIITLSVCLSFLATNYLLLHFHTWYDKFNILIYHLLTVYPTQGFQVNFTRTSQEIFVTVSILFTFLAYIYYNSVLTACITAEKYHVPFKSFDDMVRDGRFTFGTQMRTPMDFMIQNSKLKSFQRMRNKSMYKSVKSMMEGFEKIFNENFVLICPTEVCINLNCSYAILKRTYLPYDIGIHFPKHSALVESFSRGIMHLRSVGIIARVTNSFTNLNRPECEIFSDKLETVSLDQCLMPVIILGIGVVLSLVTFLIECILVNATEKVIIDQEMLKFS